MGQLFQELQRRNVIRVAIAYAVSAWLIIQVAETIFPLYGFDEGPARIVVTVLAIGFPLTLILSWIYELTPEGLKLEREIDRSRSIAHHTGKKLDRGIIVILTLALGYFAVDKFVLEPVRDAERAEAVANQVRSESLVQSFGDKSIVVLPFADLSPLGDQEYFSDGIAEELLNLLAKINDLRVISRSSAFSFKGKDLDIPQIAAKLNVAHALEGSVRKDGDDIRITVQLIDARSDTHLWSETYDRKLKNVFAIQDEIAAAVVEALKITLLGEKRKATETDPEAYMLYLQARHFSNQHTAEGNTQAEILLKQALESDPGFAPAWTALGKVSVQRADPFGLRSLDKGLELARQAIQKALDIDPQYGPAYAALASLEMDYEFDFTKSFQLLQQARTLNPGDFSILMNAAHLNRIHGRTDEAIDLYRQAVALDPVSPWGHAYLGICYAYANRLEEAAASAQMLLSLSPSGVFGHYFLGFLQLWQGDAPAALAEMEQEPSEFLRLTGTAIVQHALGNAGASDAALRALIECCSPGADYQIAQVYAYRGEIDLAFDWLDKAYASRDGSLADMLNSKAFAILHDDPRWEAFLDKMGLPHE
jgi:TolB-like protein